MNRKHRHSGQRFDRPTSHTITKNKSRFFFHNLQLSLEPQSLLLQSCSSLYPCRKADLVGVEADLAKMSLANVTGRHSLVPEIKCVGCHPVTGRG